jgi:hypothetical protein
MVVNSGVKYIETLSCKMNSVEDSIDCVTEDTGRVTSNTDSHSEGGAPLPSITESWRANLSQLHEKSKKRWDAIIL